MVVYVSDDVFFIFPASEGASKSVAVVGGSDPDKNRKLQLRSAVRSVSKSVGQ